MVSQRNRDGNGSLPEGEAKYIMYQLLTGLKYLHDKMISHRGKFRIVVIKNDH